MLLNYIQLKLEIGISSFVCNFISMGFYNVNKYIPYIIYASSAVLLCILTWLLPYEMAGKSMK